MLLIPLLGFGGQGYTARIRDARKAPPTFAEALATPEREIMLSQGNATGSLSLLVVRPIYGLRLAVGMRLMYQTALGASEWSYGEQQLIGSPRWRAEQWGVTLLFGGGGGINN